MITSSTLYADIVLPAFQEVKNSTQYRTEMSLVKKAVHDIFFTSTILVMTSKEDNNKLALYENSIEIEGSLSKIPKIRAVTRNP